MPLELRSVGGSGRDAALFARAVDPDQDCCGGQPQWLRQSVSTRRKCPAWSRWSPENRQFNSCNAEHSSIGAGCGTDLCGGIKPRLRRGGLRSKPGKQRKNGKNDPVHCCAI